MCRGLYAAVRQHALFSCVATCHHLCPADLWHHIAGLLPEDAQEARAALERAQGCNLENAEVVAEYCVPWVVHPMSQLPQVLWDVKKQVCRLSAAYIAGTGAICAYTQFNGQTVACQALLDAINLPVTSRICSKVVALSQQGPVATSGVAARRRKRTRDAQRPCRSITSYFNRPLEGAEAEARPG